MKWLKRLTDVFKPKEPKEKVIHPASGKEYETLNTHPKYTPKKGSSRKDVVTYKFTTEQRRHVLTLIAHCENTNAIIKAVKEDFGMEISARQIQQYRNGTKWKNWIRKERESYLASLSDTPGYNDKIRLERSEVIYEKALKNNNLKVALSAVDQQRREVKETGKTPVSFVFQQYNNMSEDELQDRYNQALVKIGEHKKKMETIDIKQEEKNGTG